MKYLILLFLIASCSSTKQEARTDSMRKHYKNPTQKYFQRKLINKKTQVVMTNI